MAEKLYLSAKDLATRYSVSRRTIWNWVTSGKLPKPEYLADSPSFPRWRLVDIERIEAAFLPK